MASASVDGATSRIGTGLSIRVRGATGTGPTSLAAFDDALMAAGVANFNLVRLSSVIPPGSTVVAGEPQVIDLRDGASPLSDASPAATETWGHRLYAVWAFEAAERLGEEAWAGVAWAQDPADGRGVFVEHEGRSESTVREELEASLHAICASRSLDHLPRQLVVTGARCEGQPVAALVIAPYTSEPWMVDRDV